VPTIGWIFILLGLLIARAVSRDRAMEIPEDIRDLFIAGLAGDTNGVKAVMARRGPGLASVYAGTDQSAPTSGSSSSLLAEAQRLGASAKGYQTGATGPDFYDCSGLVWRAMRNTGSYDGTRFTTATFVRLTKDDVAPVTTPATGDIVLWVGQHHMGVVSGKDLFYSARSVASGIRDGAIHTFPGSPAYYRVR
jgi:cell wall-associated NlpC family hydrolase